ncbi:elongation factor 1-gamma [Brevipalpus obovatus]|uniref:elongation factor 1-gamma n=1 Tax=Brevipalpus obovatus TaxID=246614 RepID=UPI003D9E8912
MSADSNKRPSWLQYISSTMSLSGKAMSVGEKCQQMDECFPEVKTTKEALKSLNEHLLSNTYLVGERISVADISLVATLFPLYGKMLDGEARGEYPNLFRYMDTLVHQPQFQAAVGQFKNCETAPVSKKGASKKEQPKKEKPKQAQKAPEPDDAGDFDDNGLPKEKPKDPWLALPKGNFDMDDFKRFYSNNPEDKSIPYFWEKFDKENFSIWFCEYKYPEELSLVFMTCNLITGMFQRLDKMRKWAFGSMLLFGEDHKNSISGVWVWRGQDLAFKLSPDWQVDYESYDWKKLDPDAPETKKIVDEYFRWEGDFGGKKFNQGKIFK